MCGSAQLSKDPTGIGYHDFLYAGEWQRQSMSNQVMYIVRGGKVTWQYTMPKAVYNLPGYVATGNPHGQARHHRLLKNGNILAAHMSLKKVVEYDTAQKKVVRECPSGMPGRDPSGNPRQKVPQPRAPPTFV